MTDRLATALDDAPALAAAQDLYGDFLAIHGRDLFYQWKNAYAIGISPPLHATCAVAVCAIATIQERRLATPEQLWRWLQDASLSDHNLWAPWPFPGLAQVSLGSVLARVDPLKGDMDILNHGKIKASDRQVWDWVASGANFDSSAPARKGEPPLMLLMIQSARPAADLICEWARKLPAESVDPSWASFAVVWSSALPRVPAGHFAQFETEVERAVLQAEAERSAREQNAADGARAQKGPSKRL